MSSTPPFHIRYVDNANRSSRNVTSIAWLIFSPSNKFLDLGGIFLDRATNNIVEYEVFIALVINAYALWICSLVVRLDSKLVVNYF